MMQELEMGARRRRSPEPAPDATADESAPRRSASASAVDDNDVSNQFSLLKKWTITVVVSFLAFSSTFSSTTLFPAIPEIATDYNTTGEIITFANTGYLIVSSISPLVWNPLEKVGSIFQLTFIWSLRKENSTYPSQAKLISISFKLITDSWSQSGISFVDYGIFASKYRNSTLTESTLLYCYESSFIVRELIPLDGWHRMYWRHVYSRKLLASLDLTTTNSRRIKEALQSAYVF